MPRPPDPYIAALARTCVELFNEGHHDISAEDISRAHYPSADTPPDVDRITRNLLKIRDRLEIGYGLPVCPLSGEFFVRFRDEPPQTAVDARRCLPGGAGRRTQGIHLNTSPDDLIFEESRRGNIASGAGKSRKNTDHILNAFREGRMAERRAGELLREARTRQTPSDPALAEQLVEGLPPPGGGNP